MPQLQDNRVVQDDFRCVGCRGLLFSEVWLVCRYRGLVWLETAIKAFSLPSFIRTRALSLVSKFMIIIKSFSTIIVRSMFSAQLLSFKTESRVQIFGLNSHSNFLALCALSMTILGAKRASSVNLVLYWATILLPCTNSKNSISFWSRTLSGKYLLWKVSKNVSHNNDLFPLSNRNCLVILHQCSASPLDMQVVKGAFCLSVQPRMLKIFLVCIIQDLTARGLEVSLKLGSFNRLNYSIVQVVLCL